jgi:TP901 family phage tail tape measure protein
MAGQNLAYAITVNDAELRLATQHVAAFNAELRASTVTGQKLDESFRAVGRRSAQVGGFITRNISLPLALAGAESVKLASQFDASIGKIAGLTGQSVAGVQQLRQAALDLAGKQNTAGPRELADGMYFLASAGLKTADVLKSIKPIATGAAVGLGSVDEVARLVAQTMNTYGVANLSAAHSVDILTATITKGLLPPQELATALGRVVPIARSSGVSFSQVGANIAILTREGLSANLAVTGLRAELQTFAKAQPQVQKALLSTGTTISAVQESIATKGLFPTLVALRHRFEADFGKVQSDVFTKQTVSQLKSGGLQFEEAIKEVRAKLGGAQNTTLVQLSHLFPNVRALTAFLIQTGAQLQNNQKIAAFLAATDKNVGATLQRAYQQRLAKDPSFALKQQLAQLQVVGVELGNKLLPPLVRLGEGVLGLVKGFEHLNPVIKGFLGHLALSAVVAGPLISIFGRLTQAGSGVVSLYGYIGTKATEAAYKQRGIPLEADRALIELSKTTVLMGDAINANVTAPTVRAAKAWTGLAAASKGGAAAAGAGVFAGGPRSLAKVAPAAGAAAADTQLTDILVANDARVVASAERAAEARLALNAALKSNLGTQIEAQAIAGLRAQVAAADASASAAKLNAEVIFGSDEKVVAAHQLVVSSEAELAAARARGTASIGAALAANNSIVASNIKVAESNLATARSNLASAQLDRLAAEERRSVVAPIVAAPQLAPVAATGSGLVGVRIQASGAAKAIEGVKLALKGVAGLVAFQFGVQALTDFTAKSHAARKSVGDIAASASATALAFGQWQIALPLALVAIGAKTHILDGIFHHLFGGFDSGASASVKHADALTSAIKRLTDGADGSVKGNVLSGLVLDPAVLAKIKELRRVGDDVAAKGLLQAAQEQELQRQQATSAQLLLSTEGAKGNADALNSIANATTKAATQIKAAFSTAFSNLNNQILAQFDAGVQKHLAAFDVQTQALADNLKTVVKVPSLHETFTITTNGKTPAERELDALDRLQEKRDFQRNQFDAKKDLATAFQIGDPAGIRDAQRRLQDSQLAQTKYGLEAQAKTERAAATKQQKVAQQHLSDQRAVEREHYVAAEGLRKKNLEAAIKAEEKSFQQGKINGKKFVADLMGILGKYGEFEAVGGKLGRRYGAGLTGALDKLKKLLVKNPIIVKVGKDGPAAAGYEAGTAFATHFYSALNNKTKFQLAIERGGVQPHNIPGTGAPTIGGVPLNTGIPSLDNPEPSVPTTKKGRLLAETPTRAQLLDAATHAYHQEGASLPGAMQYLLPKVGRPTLDRIRKFFADFDEIGHREALAAKQILLEHGLSRFGTGSVVPGSGSGDTVPAMLTPGELILNRSQQRKLAAMLGKPGASAHALFAHVARFGSGGVDEHRMHYAGGGVATKASRFESLPAAIRRMRDEGYSDVKIAGQLHRWHPDWSGRKVFGTIEGASSQLQPVKAPHSFSEAVTMSKANQNAAYARLSAQYGDKFDRLPGWAKAQFAKHHYQAGPAGDDASGLNAVQLAQARKEAVANQGGALGVFVRAAATSLVPKTFVDVGQGRHVTGSGVLKDIGNAALNFAPLGKAAGVLGLGLKAAKEGRIPYLVDEQGHFWMGGPGQHHFNILRDKHLPGLLADYAQGDVNYLFDPETARSELSVLPAIGRFQRDEKVANNWKQPPALALRSAARRRLNALRAESSGIGALASRLLHEESGHLFLGAKPQTVSELEHSGAAFVLRKQDAGGLPKNGPLFYHGTSAANAYSIVRSKVLRATEAERARGGAGPKGAFLTKDPAAAGFWGKYIVSIPESLIGDQVRMLPTGVYASREDILFGQTAKAAAHARAFDRSETQIFGEFEPKEELSPKNYAHYRSLSRRQQGANAREMMAKVRPQIEAAAKKLGIEITDIRPQKGLWRGEKNFGFAIHAKTPPEGYTPAYEKKVQSLAAVSGTKLKQGSLSYGRIVSPSGTEHGTHPGIFWKASGNKAAAAQVEMDKLAEGGVGFINSPVRNGYYVVNFDLEQAQFNAAAKKLGIEGKQINWQGSYLHDKRLPGYGAPGIPTFQAALPKRGAGLRAALSRLAKEERGSITADTLLPIRKSGASSALLPFDSSALAARARETAKGLGLKTPEDFQERRLLPKVHSMVSDIEQGFDLGWDWYLRKATLERHLGAIENVDPFLLARMPWYSQKASPSHELQLLGKVAHEIGQGKPPPLAGLSSVHGQAKAAAQVKAGALSFAGPRSASSSPKTFSYASNTVRALGEEEYRKIYGDVQYVTLDAHHTREQLPIRHANKGRISATSGQRIFTETPGPAYDFLEQLFFAAAEQQPGIWPSMMQSAWWIPNKARFDLRTADAGGRVGIPKGVSLSHHMQRATDAGEAGFLKRYGKKAFQQVLADYEKQGLGRSIDFQALYPKGFRRGGWVPGQHWASGDTVPAMLTPGEIVLNRSQQRNLGQMVGKEGASPEALFDHIARARRYASGGVVQKFKDGGSVRPQTKTLSSEQPVQALPLPVITGFLDVGKSLKKLVEVLGRGAVRGQNLPQDPRTSELILGGAVRGVGLRKDTDAKLASLRAEIKAGGKTNAQGSFIRSTPERLSAIEKEVKNGGIFRTTKFVADSSARLKALRHALDPVDVTKGIRSDDQLRALSPDRRRALAGRLSQLQAHPVLGGLETPTPTGATLGGRARIGTRPYQIPGSAFTPSGISSGVNFHGPITIHVDGSTGDGRQIAIEIRKELQKTGNRNAAPKRGYRSGSRVTG